MRTIQEELGLSGTSALAERIFHERASVQNVLNGDSSPKAANKIVAIAEMALRLEKLEDPCRMLVFEPPIEKRDIWLDTLGRAPDWNAIKVAYRLILWPDIAVFVPRTRKTFTFHEAPQVEVSANRILDDVRSSARRSSNSLTAAECVDATRRIGGPPGRRLDWPTPRNRVRFNPGVPPLENYFAAAP